MGFQPLNLFNLISAQDLAILIFGWPKMAKNMNIFWLCVTVILTSFLSKNVKVLRSTGPKFRKNSPRVDLATFQDELRPKFLAKI